MLADDFRFEGSILLPDRRPSLEMEHGYDGPERQPDWKAAQAAVMETIVGETCRRLELVDGEHPTPTRSVGVGVGHYMQSMGSLLELGREAEALAKGSWLPRVEQRNALAILMLRWSSSLAKPVAERPIRAAARGHASAVSTADRARVRRVLRRARG